MVNLKAKPFYLNDDQIKWVEDTIASMTDEEKIGQLFVFTGASAEEAYLKEMVDKYHLGGARYSPALNAMEVYNQNRFLQSYSRIPMLIAANTESGGNGACSDGTNIGQPVKIAATGDTHYAYEMGRIANTEAAAIGCNLSFAPQVDVHSNWQSPDVGCRAYSNDPEVVKNMGLAYLRGAHEAKPFACTAKHFPGTGMDFRDQHLTNSVNSLSCEEWDARYGTVYSAMIEAGVEAVMPGHIMQPAYTRHFNPGIRDEDIMPATLSAELLQGLLRGKLGFNGLIVSDATHMLGMTTRMKRRDLVPHCIAAGCDMFLFFNDPDEDFGFMMDGYRNGVITEERMNDALTRILGLKAKLGLHSGDMSTYFPKEEAVYQVVGCAEHLAVAQEVAQKAITLVKSKEENVLPITPEKFPRVTVAMVHSLDEYYSQQLSELQRQLSGVPEGYIARANALSGGFVLSPERQIKKLLEDRGFQVDILENIAKLQCDSVKSSGKKQINAYGLKASVESFVSQRDLVLIVSDVNMGVQPISRPAWPFPKGGTSIPWYVQELPVVVTSFGYPYLLADVPQAKTYINAYDTESHTVEAFVRKLCGEETFQGTDPVDSFCGLWDTHL